MKYYDYIAPTMRWFFNKKIAILGAESVGKSSLTKKLAKYYRTTYATEYGRIHCENNPTLTDEDFITITDEQQVSIDVANKDAYKIMFSDTEAITTKVFLPKYCLNYNKIIGKYIDLFIQKQDFDCYIVLAADNLAVQDGTRNFLSDRQSHQADIIKELELHKKNYVVLTGSYEEKFLKAVNICNKILI
jgi:HTH-type transcriptional repressor of NAD biosynthesis genes